MMVTTFMQEGDNSHCILIPLTAKSHLCGDLFPHFFTQKATAFKDRTKEEAISPAAKGGSTGFDWMSHGWSKSLSNA